MKIVYTRLSSEHYTSQSIPLAVFDLDGTLSNDQHRIKHADKARSIIAENLFDKKLIKSLWDTYHRLAFMDDPNHDAIDCIKDYIAYGNHEVWIMTARPEEYREQTLAWLNHNLGFCKPDQVIMRSSNDHRPASIIKLGHFFKTSEQREGIQYELLVDNDQSVIDACRALFQQVKLYTKP